MPRKSVTPRTPPKPKRNDKGQLLSLLVASPDGKDLKSYVDNGTIPPDMTPGDVMKKFPQFAVYEYSTFAGSLRRSRNAFQKQVGDRMNQRGGCKLIFFNHYYLSIMI